LHAEHPFGLNDEEMSRAEKFAKENGLRTLVSTVLYPLHHVKTLLQFGFEPYPLAIGKRYWFTGRDVYFLPNGFQYAKLMMKENGFMSLYNGVDAFLLSNLMGGVASFATSIYLDRHQPNVGGPPENVDKVDHQLTYNQAQKKMLREAIRDSIVKTAGVVVSHPFRVIMIRKMAQIIGGEVKYTNALSSFWLIGQEEGLRGYFSGVVPQLLVELVTVWGLHTLIFAVERGLKHMEEEGADEEDAAHQGVLNLKKMLKVVLPFAVNTIAYPFSVVAAVMAVQGSGLAVSMLPYSPPFGHWQDLYQYLKPTGGLKRGSRWFFREQDGAISVGRDKALYASYSHYA